MELVLGEEWYVLIATVLSIVLTYLVSRKYYSKFKETVTDAKEAAYALGEFLTELEKALQDDKITPEELKQLEEKGKKLYKELMDILT